jgi:outer membrane lipoprotein-sorting protein
MNLRAILRLSTGTALLVGMAVPAMAQGIPVPMARPAAFAASTSVTSAASRALTAEALVASRGASSGAVMVPVANTEAPMQLNAQAVAAPRLTAPAQARSGNAVAKVNTYFNGIRTLVGNFSQIAPDGSRTQGKFFLSKPGKARFYYQAPSTTDIIADGKSLVVRDRKLATQDVYPLGQTPLKFLLDPNLDLATDSKVVGVAEQGGQVSVALEENSTFGGKSRVLLVFAEDGPNGMQLKQWTITDPQGLDTTVLVSELDTNSKPDDKLFKVDYTRYHK